MDLPVPGAKPDLEAIVRGQVRLATSRAAKPTELLDVHKLLHHLRSNAQFNDDINGSLAALRDKALALLAICCPWRTEELAHVTRNNVFIKLAGSGVELPAIQFIKSAADEWPAALKEARGAEMRIQVVNSKGDRARRGIAKKFNDSDGLSAVRTLLAWIARTKEEPPDGTVFLQFGTQINKRSLEPDSVINIRAKLAKASGCKEAGGRAWRMSAANHLLNNGMPVEQVARAGGWSSTDTLLNFYVSEQFPSPALATKILGGSTAAARGVPASSTRARRDASSACAPATAAAARRGDSREHRACVQPAGAQVHGARRLCLLGRLVRLGGAPLFYLPILSGLAVPSFTIGSILFSSFPFLVFFWCSFPPLISFLWYGAVGGCSVSRCSDGD